MALRETIITRLRHRLERRGLPRLQMTLLVALTGGAGFLCSVALLHAGMNTLWLRYSISVGAAYLVFLGLLWLWIRFSAPDYIDADDLTRDGRQWDDGRREGQSDRRKQRDSSLDSLDSLADVGGDLDFAWPFLLALALLGAILLGCFYILYSAPLLFAELMLDGVLAAALYRRLRTLEARHWLETAVRRTFLIFLVAAGIMATAGFYMAQYAPGARSIGEVLSKLL